MPVGVGDQIAANQYNTLRNTVSTILNTGYGQTLISPAASPSVTVVSSTLLLQLYLDIQRTQVHHTATQNANIVPPPSGVSIAADTSQNYNQTTGEFSSVTNGTRMGYNDFESAVNTLSNFNPSTLNIWPAGNFTLGTALTSSRSTPWGSGATPNIYHIITVTFASSTARNQYFNAGGEIRFTASLTGDTSSKGTDWSALLSSLGTIRFSKWRTTASSGTPNPTGSGFDSLTTTYRNILTKSGSGLYAENQYIIEARNESTNVIRFRITFSDNDTGDAPIFEGFEEVNYGIDEPVTGLTTSVANTFRPNSSFVYSGQTYTAVSLPAPTIATAVELTANNTTPPA